MDNNRFTATLSDEILGACIIIFTSLQYKRYTKERRNYIQHIIQRTLLHEYWKLKILQSSESPLHFKNEYLWTQTQQVFSVSHLFLIRLDAIRFFHDSAQNSKLDTFHAMCIFSLCPFLIIFQKYVFRLVEQWRQ